METVLHYLQEVLGIRSFLQEPVAFAADVMVLVGESVESSQEEELLLKMIQALQLPEARLQIERAKLSALSGRLNEIESMKLVICFDQQLAEWLNSHSPQINLIQTWGPKDLIKNPELKKQAWLELKKGLQLLR